MIFQDVLHQRLERHREKVAIENGDAKISYAEIIERAEKITAFLTGLGLQKETIVGVQHEDRIDLICSMIGVANARCVFVALDRSLPAERLNAMIRNMDLEHIISTREWTAGGSGAPIRNYLLSDIFRDKGDYKRTTARPEFHGEDSLYIYFTSGSTGTPKAILGKNSSLLQFLDWEIGEFGVDSGSRFSQFISPYFDAFLRDVFVPLLAGGTVCIPPADDDFFSSGKMTAWIDKQGINFIHCVPSLFRVINVPSLPPAIFPDLRYIFLSGEKINPSELANWYGIFGERIRLVNFYGATETTMIRSFYRIGPQDALQARIPIGNPISDTELLIARKDLSPCNSLVVGDLYIISPYVSKGYLNDPELTNEKFVRLGQGTANQRIAFKTGDKARKLANGYIELLGREDRQVKLRGIRINLDEIESDLLKSGMVRNALVIVREDGNKNEYLVAFVIKEDRFPDDQLFKGEIAGYLEASVPGYMIPRNIVVMPEFPMLSNGKADYKALIAHLEEGKKIVAPANGTEKRLLGIWKEILGDKPISCDDSFHQIGGNSLTIMGLIGKIHKEFDVRISLSELFRNFTIRKQAEFIIKGEKERMEFIPKADLQNSYALSSAQKRLYFLYELDRSSLAYNMPQIVRLEGQLDMIRFREALQKLISRHGSLRTSFDIVNGDAVQRPNSQVQFDIEYFRCTEEEAPAIVKTFVRPFDLGVAPLMRVGLLEVSSGEHILIVDVHHIISDGMSQSILVGDFMALYNDEQLPDLTLGYEDFAQWQQGDQQQERIARQRYFWMNEFTGEIPKLQLPADFLRPAHKSYVGDLVQFNLGEEETAGLKAIAAQEGATMFMVMLSAFSILLSRLSGQEDIILCTPIAGRHYPGLENMIGMFANTLPLRTFPRGNQSFRSFLAAIKAHTLSCYDNQDYPYEELADSLHLERDMSRNPLFDVMLAYEDFKRTDLEIPGLRLKPYAREHTISKFDMTVFAADYGDRLEMNVEYCTALFKRATIERFVGYFKQILSSVRSDIDTRIADIEILPELERSWLLTEFSNVGPAMDDNRTITGMFGKMVAERGDATALVFDGKSMSYRELDGRTDRVAALIRSLGSGNGDRIGILLRRSERLIISILAVLKAGCAYVPIDPDYPTDRISYIADDSKITILLTEPALEDLCTLLSDRIRPIDVTNEAMTWNANLEGTIISGASLAYMIYTSGSTGRPKGVMVEHRNVVNFVQGFTEKIPLTTENAMLALASTAFDMSIGEVILPLLCGVRMVLASGNDQKDVDALIRLIIGQHVDVLHITPSHLKLLLSAGGSDILQGIKILMVGAEPFPPDLLDEVRRCYKGPLYNMYGPTETTVWSTIQDLSGNVSIGLGRPITNTTIRILNAYQKLQPAGVAGEIYIGGKGVTRGYWRNETLTREKFIPDPVSSEGLVYRTGDLARWMMDGSIEFLGRADNQVKIRGLRIETGEIESRLAGFDQVKQVIVVAKEKQGDKILVAYYTSEKSIMPAELRDHLARSLPAYMIPSHFVHMFRMPLNPNGKIDRKALPDPEIKQKGIYIPPASELQKTLQGIWRDVLGIDAGLISMNSNFFDLGGHSLKAMVLVNKIFKETGMEIPLRKIFDHSDILSQEKLLRSLGSAGYASIPIAEHKPFYPVSDAQRAMYFLYELDKSTLAYNQPMIVRIDGDLDYDRLREAFDMLIKRHEIFRTSFRIAEGEPVQQVSQSSDFRIEYFEAEEEEVRSVMAPLFRPFDLGKAPLIRACVVMIDARRHYLMVDTHHMIVDGISQGILIKELADLYNGTQLPALKLQYKDYSEWQRSPLRQEKLKRQKQFWVDVFSDEIPILELPTDDGEPDVRDLRGSSIDLDLSIADTDALKSIAEAHGASLFMAVLAVYNIFLGKLTNLEDIMIGTLVAGREHIDIEDMLGMFVSVLPLRNRPKGELSVYEFLKAVKINALASLDHQAYQYRAPLDELTSQRNADWRSIFNAFFVYQNFQRDTGIRIPGLTFNAHDFGRMLELRYGMTLIAGENNGALNLRLCSNKLFKKDSIQKMADYFTQIIQQVLKDPNAPIARLELITDAEKALILHGFNNTRKDIDKDMMLSQLFSAQVKRTPQRIAVEHNGTELTYVQLYDNACKLSGLLRRHGPVAGKRVAVCMPRGIDMLAGILAVFMARGVYVPIDITHPTVRIRDMVEDSESELILANGETMDQAMAIGETIPGVKFVIDIDGREQGTSEDPAPSMADDLAYIIYTSGTTGKPKGVMIHQLGMVNHLQAKIDALTLDSQDIVAQTAGPTFDISIWQFLACLLTGGKICIIDKEKVLDPELLVAELRRGKITVFQSVPSLMTAYLDGLPEAADRSLPALRWVVPTGERLSPALVKQWRSIYPEVQMMNAYGPAEASDDVTHYVVDGSTDGQQVVPVGRPIQNTHIYILDKYLNLCPPGVQGEICVAGLGVGKGYWKNEDQTSGSFVPNHIIAGSGYEAYGTLYRTGDIGYYKNNGDVVCLGRMDDQEKVLGFRLEPGEIENVLVDSGGVKESAVIVLRRENKEKKIVAFVVPADPSAGISGYRSVLKARLPDYMIPSYIVRIDKMPLTTNGKIDKKALYKRAMTTEENLENYIEPVTDVEKMLAEIWKDVLGIDQVGLNDTFFDLGGRSLLLFRSNQRIKSRFDVEIPLKLYFDHTLEQMAFAIGERMAKPRMSGDLEPKLHETF